MIIAIFSSNTADISGLWIVKSLLLNWDSLLIFINKVGKETDNMLKRQNTANKWWFFWK